MSSFQTPETLLYWDEKKYPELINFYEQAITSDPNFSLNYWYLGLAYLLQGSPEEAEAIWLTALVETSPEDVSSKETELIAILIQAANRKVNLLDYQAARLIRLSIQELDPEHINNLLALLWLFIELDEWQQNPSLSLQISQLLLNSQRNQEVNRELLWRVLETVMAINPYDSFVEVGLSYFTGETNNEIEPVQKLREQYFNNSLTLAWNLFNQKNYTAAFWQFERILNINLELEPKQQAELLYFQGLCWFNLGELSKALNCLEKSQQKNPEFVAGAEMLTRVRYRLHGENKGYQFTQDWFSRNIANFQKTLAQYINTSGIKALEIGSWEGRSSCWLLENILTHPDAHLTCVDTFAGSFEHKNWFNQAYLESVEARFDHNISLTNAGHKIEKKVGTAYEIMRGLPLNHYDFIYIDGSHLACDVLSDGVLAWELLKVGGLMIFDDYDFTVPEAPHQNTKVGIDAFLTVFGHKLKILQQNHQIMVEKIEA